MLPFENTRIFTLFIPPKPRSMAYLGNEAEAPEAMVTFTPIVTRPIAGESQLFRGSTNELLTLGSSSPSILDLSTFSRIEFPWFSHLANLWRKVSALSSFLAKLILYWLGEDVLLGEVYVLAFSNMRIVFPYRRGYTLSLLRRGYALPFRRS